MIALVIGLLIFVVMPVWLGTLCFKGGKPLPLVIWMALLCAVMGPDMAVAGVVVGCLCTSFIAAPIGILMWFVRK